jgi:hypothetical protein
MLKHKSFEAISTPVSTKTSVSRGLKCKGVYDWKTRERRKTNSLLDKKNRNRNERETNTTVTLEIQW